MTITEAFKESSSLHDIGHDTLLRNMPEGMVIIAPYNLNDLDAAQNWSLMLEGHDREIMTCDFTYEPDNSRIAVDSIMIDESIGRNGLGRQMVHNIVEFSQSRYPAVTIIEADAGEDYGGIAWAAWGFYHDPNSGVREQAQERLKHLRVLMDDNLFHHVEDILSENNNLAALCQIARMKDDVGGYPLNLLLLGETDGHVSLDLNDPVQMAMFNQPASLPNKNRISTERPKVHDALEMFGLD